MHNTTTGINSIILYVEWCKQTGRKPQQAQNLQEYLKQKEGSKNVL